MHYDIYFAKTFDKVDHGIKESVVVRDTWSLKRRRERYIALFGRF